MEQSSASFPHRSQEEQLMLSLIIGVIMITSALGNLVIVGVLVKFKRLLLSFANKLVLSLAVVDLATATLLMSYQLATFVDISLISRGGLLCSLGGYTSYMVFLISILTMVMLSLDRFVALGYPLKYKRRLTSSIKVFMIVYPWLHSLIFTIFCVIFLEIKFDPVSMDCGLNWKDRHIGFIIFSLVVHFVVPFTLLLVTNALTLHLVRSHNRVLAWHDAREVGFVPRARNASFHRRRAQSETKLAKISMTIVLTFLVCWLPFVVTRVLSIYCCPVPTNMLIGAVIIVDLTSLLNPIIYSSLRSDLRQAICDLFRRPTNTVRVHPVTVRHTSVTQLQVIQTSV